jgi:hypothetical protein
MTWTIDAARKPGTFLLTSMTAPGHFLRVGKVDAKARATAAWRPPWRPPP